jgi:sporulation protein YlmC with PRC-barrel domain
VGGQHGASIAGSRAVRVTRGWPVRNTTMAPEPAVERGLLRWETRRPAMTKFRRTLGATSLIQDKVVNLSGQDIGRIEELMIDVTTGRVAYAVMSFGGFMGIGNKLFALPWSAITVDEAKKRFVVNVTRESLDQMPGFDKDHWPDLGDLEYATGVYRQWGATPYWT